MPTGGELIVQCLKAQGADRIFCVPGESYLAVLDALADGAIETVVARHEGGASIMAEADGKMTGRPGICMVTRGPGVTNALAGVHIAQQDSTPMILFVGQVTRGERGRGGFQEVDYRRAFGDFVKWSDEIDDPARIPEIVSRAYHVAMSGRPGPVILALPEDMLRESADVAPGPRVEVAEPAPLPASVAAFGEMLAEAERPMVVAGGSRWTPEAAAELRAFSERWDLPVAVQFRRAQLFDQQHPNFAGDVGLGINPALKARLAESDLLILLGGRFSEIPSQGFTLLDIPAPKQRVVHVHPGPEELGRVYAPALPVNATPGAFLGAVRELNAPERAAWAGSAAAAHADFLGWTEELPETPGALAMDHVIRTMRHHLPPEAVVTNGAGNYAIWVNRFWRFRQFGTQLAPVSGSMGYGLPAAVAAKLRDPSRPVICLAGDGCFQMTMNEFGTAAQLGLGVVVLVCDNGMYGTIRMHQEREYPGRVSATGIVNPDYAAMASAYGAYAAEVPDNTAFTTLFPQALEAAAEGRPALLHLKLDPRVIAPGRLIEA